MQPDIIRLTVRQVLTRGRLVVLLIVTALPPFLAALFAASDATTRPELFLSRLCDGLVLTTVLPLLALVIGGAALGNEVEDGTIIYLLMKPAPRWGIIASKMVVTVTIVAALTALSVLLSAALAGRDGGTLRVGLAFSVAAVAGALAYTTAFLYLGLLTSRSLVVGLLYAFLWEGALTGLFAGLRLLSIRQYARAIAKALAGLPANDLSVRLTAQSALIGVAVVTVAAFALAVRRLNVMDVD